jgi:hypothetical protein
MTDSGIYECSQVAGTDHIDHTPPQPTAGLPRTDDHLNRCVEPKQIVTRTSRSETADFHYRASFATSKYLHNDDDSCTKKHPGHQRDPHRNTDVHRA